MENAQPGGEETVRINYSRWHLDPHSRRLFPPYDNEEKNDTGDELHDFDVWSWIPFNDRPGDKATLAINLLTNGHKDSRGLSRAGIGPGKWIRREKVSDKQGMDQFTLNTPAPAYLFGFTIGQFFKKIHKHPAARVALENLLADPNDGESDQISNEFQQMLRFFEERSGVPYPASKYRQVFTDETRPQKMAGFSLLPSSYLARMKTEPREDGLAARGLAYQWWGNLVTCDDWGDFWLNEAVAVFMAAAYKEQRWGRDEYDREMILARQSFEKLRLQGKDRPLALPAGVSHHDVAGPLPRTKGRLVLHLLRDEIGDSAFWAALKSYTLSNTQQAVTTDTLRVAMEQASGKDLALFFRQWVFTAGVPEVTVRHRQEGDSLLIEVEQGDLTGEFPLWIAVETSADRQRRREVIRERQQQFRLSFTGELWSVRVDDGGQLPFSVKHPRPASMLLWQFLHEPDAPGRFEAIERLVVLCQSTPFEPTCERFRKELLDHGVHDSSRVVQDAAKQALTKIFSGVKR